MRSLSRRGRRVVGARWQQERGREWERCTAQMSERVLGCWVGAGWVLGAARRVLSGQTHRGLGAPGRPSAVHDSRSPSLADPLLCSGQPKRFASSLAPVTADPSAARPATCMRGPRRMRGCVDASLPAAALASSLQDKSLHRRRCVWRSISPIVGNRPQIPSFRPSGSHGQQRSWSHHQAAGGGQSAGLAKAPGLSRAPSGYFG